MSEATSILQAARRRADARAAATPRIDYARMQRARRGQKAALTRAINSKDVERITIVCRDAVRLWDECGAWPDDWARWECALNDALPWHSPVDLRDLEA